MRGPSTPYAVPEEQEGLQYLAVEISYGSQWININDGERYLINAQNTRDSTQKSWRKVETTSPVLGGSYLVHAVPDMVTEQISVWIYGDTQTDLADNFFLLDQLFEQYDYRIRWTFNEYVEYWRCSLAQGQSSRGHVFTHNQMAMSTFSVPRYPDVARERI